MLRIRFPRYAYFRSESPALALISGPIFVNINPSFLKEVLFERVHDSKARSNMSDAGPVLANHEVVVTLVVDDWVVSLVYFTDTSKHIFECLAALVSTIGYTRYGLTNVKLTCHDGISTRGIRNSRCARSC